MALLGSVDFEVTQVTLPRCTSVPTERRQCRFTVGDRSVEPPDLEVRVYEVGGGDSLKRWLVSVGFIDSGTVAKPYRNGSVSGLKVCKSTMIAPGCSVYVFQSARVY